MKDVYGPWKQLGRYTGTWIAVDVVCYIDKAFVQIGCGEAGAEAVYVEAEVVNIARRLSVVPIRLEDTRLAARSWEDEVVIVEPILLNDPN